MTFQQIPLSWAERQAAGAVANGLSLDQLFDRALITPKFGDDRDQISPLQLMVFDAALVLETDDCTHSMVRHRLAPAIGPLGFRILFGSASLGDGLVALSKFYQFSSRSIRMQLTTEGNQAFFGIQVEDDRGRGFQQEDNQLIYLYLGLTSFLKRRFPVTWIGTRDQEHFSVGSAHYSIGSPVKLHKCAGFAFSKALLACQPPSGGIDDFSWQPINVAIDLMSMATTDLRQGINKRNFRVDTLAADLMMGPSSYRRMLARNGIGFRQLRERALLDAALDLLKTQTSSVEAIADNLGFSDSRSLRRFVKRATGRTPQELRQSSAVAPERLRSRLREILGLMPL